MKFSIILGSYNMKNILNFSSPITFSIRVFYNTVRIAWSNKHKQPETTNPSSSGVIIAKNNSHRTFVPAWMMWPVPAARVTSAKYLQIVPNQIVLNPIKNHCSRNNANSQGTLLMLCFWPCNNMRTTWMLRKWGK